MIVYDVTKRESLSKVEVIKRQIETIRSGCKFLPLVIVGNKTDLEHSRTVDETKARAQARSLEAQHVGCSACGSERDVRFAFDELCREVARVRQRLAQKRERRRSSLSQMRQGLKMLVQTKTKSSYNGTPASGNSSPIGGLNGRCLNNNNSRKAGKFSQSSPFSTLVSPPLLNDLPEEDSLQYMSLIMKDDQRQDRDSSSDSREENQKRSPPFQQKLIFVS